MATDYSELSEEDFFHYLLKETDIAYQESDVFKLNPKWAYSVCGTPIFKKQGLILGLNWGGGNNETFEPQENYPNGNDVKNYPFIMKLAPFLKDYLTVNDIKLVNYSNLCFFRTPRVQDLTPTDWDCSEKLIQKYITYIDPAWILLTSTSTDRAQKSLKLEDPIRNFTAGNGRIYTAHKSMCTISEKRIPFYALPHPNARVKGEVRKKLWDDILPIKPFRNG